MEIKVEKKEKLIKFLIHNVQGLSFANAQKMLRKGLIKVNNKRTKDNIDIVSGDIIDIFTPQISKPKVDVLYSDENILIVNKPAGIECATRDKSSENTYSLEELTSEYNGIIVHRLDRLTEGIVILARNKEIAIKFEEYFRKRKIDKFYKAFIYGKPSKDGIMTAYLYKDSINSKVKISDIKQDGYKEIITEFKVIKEVNNNSLVDIKLHTGRTHQIRSHFHHLGHPIINDNKYTNDKNFIDCKYKGYFLTSYKVKFNLDDSDPLNYLNNLDIEITPSWLDFLKQN
jgi:23S rRNA pseudouridine955/2504/2580 synthase